MKIIDKYILKQLVVGFTLVLAGMTVLVWLTQSLKMIDMIVTKGVSVGMFLKTTVLVLPNFMQILSPLALFAVVLFVYTRMQSDKELMVMKAVGMSNKDIMRAPFIFAAVLVGLGYIFSLVVVPSSNTQMRELKWQIKNNLSHLMLQEGQFNSFKNLTIYIRERLPDGIVKGVIVYDTKNPKHTSALVAQEGVIYQDGDETQVMFQNGVRQEFSSATKEFSVLKFDKYTMAFSEKDRKTLSRSSDVREYPLGYLFSASQDEAGSPQLFRKFKVEGVKRLLQPLYNLTFMFLAMFGVLAGHYNRRGQVGQINFVVGTALIVQSLALAFENMTGKNLLFMPLMFINVLLPIAVVYFVLVQGKKWKIGLVKIGAFLFAILFAGMAMAKPNIDLTSFDKNAPVNFESDMIEYDKNEDILTAKGNVVIEQNGSVITTEELVFDRKNNTGIIPKKAVLRYADGTETTAENMRLTDKMNEAVAYAIAMQLTDGTYIAADKLKRTDSGKLTYLKNLTYTPCDRCEGKAPLWRLRSRTMKHDTNEKTMSFMHSFFEVKNVPVFYFPYVSIPDFSVRRKTGLLAPSFSHSSEMGNGIRTPLFIDMADNQNLTITPTISVDHLPLITTDYQGLFTRGATKWQLSGTKDDRDEKKYQGHIKSDFEYDISDNWRATGEIFRTSSDTYFKRYKIAGIDDTQSYLSSHLTAERFGTDNYFRLKALSFQNLQADVDSKTQPVVIPTGHFTYKTEPLFGSSMYAFSEADSALLHDRQRLKSDRLSVTQGVHMPYVSSYGAVYDVVASVRADGYNVDSGKVGFAGRNPNDSYTTGRIYPNLSVESSLPMTMATENTTQVLKPIVMGVISPNRDNVSDKIPNMDSLDFDFDDTNLFSRNRFTGYDRVETGARVNYGAEWSMYTNRNAAVSTLFGQSYRFNDDEDMARLLGEDKHLSDYVGRVSVDYDYITLAYRFRLAEDNFAVKKNEITLTGGDDPLRVGMDYVYLKDSWIGDTLYKSREEIRFFGSSRLTRQWSLAGSYRYDLAKDGGPIESDISLRYDNECTAVIFDVSKSFTKDRDYRGDTSFMVKFVLKTLGGGV